MSNETKHGEAREMTVKRITLWRGEIDGSPGALATALQPLAEAGIRLQVFMRYRHFRDEKRAVVEVCPYTAEEESRCSAVLQAAGLKVSKVPALIVESDPVTGLEYSFAHIVAEQNLHLIFCTTQTVNGTWMALMGFESDMDAEKAAVSLLAMKGSVPIRYGNHDVALTVPPLPASASNRRSD